jgi:hypothetical protein
MIILSNIRSLWMPGLCMAVATESALAQATAPDGRSFEGVVLERGTWRADTLIFDKGRFRSTACDRYGYGMERTDVGVRGRRCFEAGPKVRSNALLWKGSPAPTRWHADDGPRRSGHR